MGNQKYKYQKGSLASAAALFISLNSGIMRTNWLIVATEEKQKKKNTALCNNPPKNQMNSFNEKKECTNECNYLTTGQLISHSIVQCYLVLDFQIVTLHNQRLNYWLRLHIWARKTIRRFWLVNKMQLKHY